jgi:hypothetical protein
MGTHATSHIGETGLKIFNGFPIFLNGFPIFLNGFPIFLNGFPIFLNGFLISSTAFWFPQRLFGFLNGFRHQHNKSKYSDDDYFDSYIIFPLAPQAS